MKLKMCILQWLFVLLVLQCVTSNDGAVQFVDNLYSNYSSNDSNFSSIAPRSIDTIFSPAFIKALKANENQNQEGLGFDPVCDCQDDAGFKLEKTNVQIVDGKTIAKVNFSIGGTSYDVKLILVKMNDKWLIGDIVNSRGSLLEMLERDLNKN